jgi:transposase
MEVIYAVCAGLDVHKDSVKACLRRSAPNRQRIGEVQSFGTTTRELLRMTEWLSACGCSHVAMESTGVYWKPVYNLLEGSVEVILVNAAHIKQVPGRKTDVKDCEWIAQLLEHGLLRKSFIPPKPIRELRDLTRHRKTLIQERARTANRVQKILEDANVKLASVASDVLGVSGRAILAALINGERDSTVLAALTRGRLHATQDELQEALTGRFTEHHSFLLGQLLAQVDFVAARITECDQRIEVLCRPFAQKIDRLKRMAGVGQRAAEQLVSELGVDMGQFPSHRHAASWTGICPGNHESAGKRKSGKTRKGNRWLRCLLIECGWAASRSKQSYFGAQFRHLVRRRGAKKAAVAVGHSLLVAAYHILRDDVEYRDLGADHFDRLNHHRLTDYHVQRLEQLGYQVNLQSQPDAA